MEYADNEQEFDNNLARAKILYDAAEMLATRARTPIELQYSAALYELARQMVEKAQEVPDLPMLMAPDHGCPHDTDDITPIGGLKICGDCCQVM